MRIGRMVVRDDNGGIPSVIITPDDPKGAAVLVHGYGGCREELLGMAWRVAEIGLAACSIDLRGHGENPTPLDDQALRDVEAAIAQSREYGRVVSIGHSLGGRLSLISSADFAVGISPPLDKKYSDSTLAKLEKLRSYRVRPNDPRVVFDALERMPMWNPSTKDALIIYGSRDVPEIVASCNILCDSGENVIKIEQGLHSDTYLLDSTYMAVVRQLAEWFHND